MITVVIPAYNEEEGVAATVEGLGRVLSEAGIAAEVVVVDDGSTDATGARAAAAGARVVRHPHNVGYGRALKDGILAAQHDTVVIADADGTYPPAHVPALLAEYGKGFDMVVGARSGGHYRESALKAPLRWALKVLVEFTAGRRVPDVNSGLRVFSRATVTPSFRHLSDSFSFTTSLTLAYMMTGKFVSYLPIGYGPRVGRSKVHLLRDSLRTLQYIVQAIAYYNPVKLFLLLSLGAVALALAFLASGLLAGSPAALVVGGVGLFTALLLFALGLVADLLRQILGK
ncbi:MAG TPA: glycosyltransferase family 2 protein [Vicinamibacteria bacterium]|jgi:glycosyltransferase involved in cell wall biosynthesis